MSRELHLPDLPEIPVSLGKEPGDGGRRPRGKETWRRRVSGLIGTALPIMLMAVLAIGTWWLVKNAPDVPGDHAKGPARHVPDYTIAKFTMQRFGVDGQMSAQVEGDHLRHYPDDDTFEIDAVHVIENEPDGRVTRATAREAWGTGDGDLIKLIGAAHVVSTDAQGQTVEIFGEELTAEVNNRRVRSERPVLIVQGRTEVTANSMVYDQATGQVDLGGPARAVLSPAVMKSRGVTPPVAGQGAKP